MCTMERRILEELVYGRVRRTVNLCQLVIIEQELEENIQRAMTPDEDAGAEAEAEVEAEAEAGAGGAGMRGPGIEVGGAEVPGPGPGAGAGGAAVPGREPGELARGYVQRAWERLAREWSALREDLGRAECARCVGGAGCVGGECDAP